MINLIAAGALLVLAVLPAALAIFGQRGDSALLAFLILFPVYVHQKTWILELPTVLGPLVWPALLRDLVAVIIAIRLWPVVRRTDATRPLRWLLVAAYLGLVAGLIQSPSPLQAVVFVRSYIAYPVLGLVFGAALSRWPAETWARLARGVSVSVGVVTIVALVHRHVDGEFFVQDFMRLFAYGEAFSWDTGSQRLRSLTPHPNTLGYMMALHVLVLTTLRPTLRRPPQRWMALAGIAGGAYVLLLTGSRSAILGLLVALLVRAALTGVAGAARSLLVLGAGVAIVLSTGLLAGRLDNPTDNPRLEIWATHLTETVRSTDTVLLGSGVGSSFRVGSIVQRSDVNITGISDVVGGESDQVAALDNTYVRAAFELGVVGLFYIGMVMVSLRRALRRGTAALSATRVTLCSLSIMVIVISVFSDSLLTYPWNLLVWLTVGALYSARPRRAPDNVRAQSAAIVKRRRTFSRS